MRVVAFNPKSYSVSLIRFFYLVKRWAFETHKPLLLQTSLFTVAGKPQMLVKLMMALFQFRCSSKLCH